MKTHIKQLCDREFQKGYDKGYENGFADGINSISFLEAVDIVCLECHFLSEENCSKCFVRKCCENFKED